MLVAATMATLNTGGIGTVASDGTFSVKGVGATITGAVDANTTVVSGSVVEPNQPPQTYSGVAGTTAHTDRLINLSSRANVDPATGSTLITGFVIGGAAPKQVLLRVVGPTLGVFGFNDFLANPTLLVFDSTGKVIAETRGSVAANDAIFGQVGAFSFAAGSKDAALVTTLAPGAYTMQVATDGGAGVALAEIYDASANPQGEYQRLVNISSRGTVTSGSGILIGGFVVTGNSPKKVLVRGVGPGLAPFGVSGALADPRLTIYSGSTIIAQNDDWGIPQPVSSSQAVATGAEIAVAAQATGAFAYVANSKDAAVIVTLAPGAYTAQVTSAAGRSSGVALVEIYELPQ